MKQLRLAVAICAVSGLQGCSSVLIDGSCQVFKPISTSTQDTTQTRREVVAHNKVYGAICKGQP